VVITSGRYLREFASGNAGAILTYHGDPKLTDLKSWRAAAGLSEKPALAVVSRQLDLDLGAAQTIGDSIIGITSASAEEPIIADLRDSGVAVIQGRPSAGVTGREIAEGLHALGQRTAFSSAGPRIAHLLLEDKVLDRLYVTYLTTMLGGDSFATLNEGTLFATPVSMNLRSLFLDADRPRGGSRIFSSFGRA
jgi:riboflavin biosynthesis pyrimidine reductase